jgi:very-short-patch-repair endonuclease
MRGEQPWRTNRARALRSQPISAEAKLWAKLRNRQLGGLKFVRQAPIGPYFADFLCRERRIVVEVDGSTHGTEAELAGDAARTAEFGRLGYRVFRVRNIDVFENIERVLDALLGFIEGEGRESRG